MPRKFFRVPVTIKVGWVPPGSSAWVPWRRTIVLRDRKYLFYRKLIAHELSHVLQHERYGIWFYPLYVWQWIRDGFRYREIDMEEQAEDDSNDPFLLAWADELIADWHRARSSSDS